MVNSGQRACISVGVRILEDHRKTVGEHDVRFITKADLFEVSLVRDGCCETAHAATINTRYASDLEPGKKGLTFTFNQAAHNLKRVEQRMARRTLTIQSIASKLDRNRGYQLHHDHQNEVQP